MAYNDETSTVISYLKMIQKIYKSYSLSFAEISNFSLEISKCLLHQKIQIQLHSYTKFLILLTLFYLKKHGCNFNDISKIG